MSLSPEIGITFHSQGQPREYYRNMEAAVASLPPGDNSLAAQRLRGTVLSHREWLAAHAARARLRRRGGQDWKLRVSSLTNRHQSV
jgi:hypothetical protein